MRRAVAAIACLLCTSIAVPAFTQEAVVVVATRTIYPGETVSSDALEEITLRAGATPQQSVALSFEELEGKVARRTILPKRYIPLAAVRDPFLVDRGKPAQVFLREGGLIITITAVPLESGSAGDRIRVRNVDSGAIFDGIVLADGTIQVGAG